MEDSSASGFGEEGVAFRSGGRDPDASGEFTATLVGDAVTFTAWSFGGDGSEVPRIKKNPAAMIITTAHAPITSKREDPMTGANGMAFVCERSSRERRGQYWTRCQVFTGASENAIDSAIYAGSASDLSLSKAALLLEFIAAAVVGFRARLDSVDVFHRHRCSGSG